MSTPAPRIVVGVDGSPGSATALRWALDEARLRSATLDVVHAWTAPYVYGPLGMYGYTLDPAEFEREAKQVVEKLLRDAEVADDGRVRPVVTEGRPAAVLIAAAEGADLLVVGSRGLGGFAGLALGSVSHQCVHHAACPVVVIPEQG
jgi:nucleotide-binding universal stress UspA family protein